ncbi:MAG: hypothetical protein JO265_07965, partial [Acidimicrobiia bacterium]|nr:hypothetical protein [Acidimicrobiia bacterium]
ARAGAVAAMSVRTTSRDPSIAEGYATLGAGTRVSAGGTAGAAYDAPTTPGTGTATAPATTAPATGVTGGPGAGRPLENEVVAADGPAILGANKGKHLSSLPGAVGTALKNAHRTAAVVGNADIGAVSGRAPVISRPGAVAVMDSSSVVAGGAVEPGDVLVADPSSPFGQRADADKVLSETTAALQHSDLVVVDTGDPERAAAVSSHAPAAVAAQTRAKALARTDDVLGRVERILPPRTLLLVVSVVPPDTSWRLTPVVAFGAGVVKGYLQSPSTERLGLVTLTDVGPTALGSLGVAVPNGMVGHPLRYHPATVDFRRLAGLDRDGTTRGSTSSAVAVGFVLLHAAVYLVAALALWRRRSGPVEPFVRCGALAIAALPVSSFLVKALRLDAVAYVALIAVVDALIVAVAARARRRPLSALAWVMGFTAVVLMIDIATGARLQMNSVLGYAPQTSARFFGIGNSAFAVLAATGILAAAIHMQYAPRRRDAFFTVAGCLVLLVCIDGAPSLGADVGGILTLVPVIGWALLALRGRRLSWRSVAALAGVTVAVLGAALVFDLLRPPEARTHLGRVFTDVHHGGLSSLFTTVARKIATNLQVFRTTWWSWLVPIIAALLLYFMTGGRRLAQVLPRGSAVRIGVIAALAAGLLGFAVNDSGVVITALVYVYLGPFLLLLVMDDQRAAPEVLEPIPSARAAALGSPSPSRAP